MTSKSSIENRTFGGRYFYAYDLLKEMTGDDTTLK
ncbi:hypothetical protein UC3_03071 [Enterococcus phoeniculicola ATCC BAA-412]|uniref:Uncharacterized protein n=1 Tax=Enterococcus phoeniculicola ATCC BAA-412 TaxID=1158610 RepID=R3TNS6_9ENTE|nr:hypothetical protein UC3_03071 [Enterococcus phoeniculicola ATCC BAA-412]EOT78998.1 hypothetical protein I589_00505 [Enterococcus phoeniculicola ATCC BAA-412]